MNKNLLVVALLVVLGAGAGYFIGYDIGYERANKAGINTFAECKEAGYPIQESFPEVCAGPNGRSFINPAQSH